jgi:hypothetical protein
MLPNDVDFQARERQQDLLREAEREQLAQEASSQADNGQTLRQAAGWIGNQMVKWGTKLQDYSSSSSSEKK